MSKLLTLLTSLPLLIGCHNSTSRNIEYNLRGTYVLQRQESGTSLRDTIMLSPVAEKATHLFALERRINVIQQGESRHQSISRSRHIRLSAEFDPEQNYLYVFETAEHYFLQGDGKILTNGIVAYVRLK